MKDTPIGIELTRIIYRHWRMMALLVLAAGAGSALFTMPFFMDPVFKAETIIYPSSSNTSNSLINSDMRFGAEKETDNQIQILQSTILRDSMIKKYNLVKHYHIDSLSPNQTDKVNKAYNTNISIEQTRYASIKISVMDKDPALAARMANDMVKTGDEVKSEIIKKNLRSAFTSINRELNAKIEEIAILGDSISNLKHKNYHDATALKLGEYNAEEKTVNHLENTINTIRNEQGVYELDNQFNMIYKNYMDANSTYLTDSGIVAIMQKHFAANDTALVKKEAEMNGSRILVVKLKKKLDALNESGKRYNDAADRYSIEKGILGGLKSEYEIAASTYDKDYNNLKLETLRSKYAAELQLYNIIKGKYELAFSNLTDQVPASYVVSPASVPTTKYAPQRSLIALMAMAVTFLTTILFYLLLARISSIQSVIRD